MEIKRIIVPKGENPMIYLKKEDVSKAIVYFDSNQLEKLKQFGKLICGCSNGTNETMTFLVNDEVIVISSGYGIMYHKLMRVGIISCDTTRHDSRNKILIFVGE